MNDVALTAKDFATDQEVRWCPGCGDYAVLKAIKTVLADIGARRENTVFVEGNRSAELLARPGVGSKEHLLVGPAGAIEAEHMDGTRPGTGSAIHSRSYRDDIVVDRRGVAEARAR